MMSMKTVGEKSTELQIPTIKSYQNCQICFIALQATVVIMSSSRRYVVNFEYLVNLNFNGDITLPEQRLSEIDQTRLK